MVVEWWIKETRRSSSSLSFFFNVVLKGLILQLIGRGPPLGTI